MPDIEQLYDEPSDFIMPQKIENLESRRNTNTGAFRHLNVNEFTSTADVLQQTGRSSVKHVPHAAKLQGAQIYRSKRDLSQRMMSADENQFIKKGQEMVHSFHDDDHSKSYISANKADRASVFSGVQTTVKDTDPVIIDWNQATNNNNDSYMNQK